MNFIAIGKKIQNNFLIGKPSEGSGGSGIVIFKSLKDMSGSTFKNDCVIQSYVMNPLLINKKKWDMRVYVMVHGISPMKAYIATDGGLARFGTEEYNTSKTQNIYSHLTNYSLNKNSEEYVKDVAFDENSDVINTKLSLKDVWRLVQKNYPDADVEADGKQKMRDLVINVMTAARSTIELGYIEVTGK